jgi:hypothetical protein
MIHIVAYIMASYIAILSIIILIGRILVMKSKSYKSRLFALIYIIACALLLIAPAIPYILVNYWTQKYGAEFDMHVESALKSIGAASDSCILEFKVLRITKSSASIYVVSNCESLSGYYDSGYIGTIIYFVKGKDGWLYTGRYDTVWSDCGSANGNVFPPYRGRGEYKR